MALPCLGASLDGRTSSLFSYVLASCFCSEPIWMVCSKTFTCILSWSFSFLSVSFYISSSSQRDSSVCMLVSSSFYISTCLSRASLIVCKPLLLDLSSSFKWTSSFYKFCFSCCSFSILAISSPFLAFVVLLSSGCFCSRLAMTFCSDSILISFNSQSRYTLLRFYSLARHLLKSSCRSCFNASSC